MPFRFVSDTKKSIHGDCMINRKASATTTTTTATASSATKTATRIPKGLFIMSSLILLAMIRSTNSLSLSSSSSLSLSSKRFLKSHHVFMKSQQQQQHTRRRIYSSIPGRSSWSLLSSGTSSSLSMYPSRTATAAATTATTTFTKRFLSNDENDNNSFENPYYQIHDTNMNNANADSDYDFGSPPPDFLFNNDDDYSNLEPPPSDFFDPFSEVSSSSSSSSSSFFSSPKVSSSSNISNNNSNSNSNSNNNFKDTFQIKSKKKKDNKNNNNSDNDDSSNNRNGLDWSSLIPSSSEDQQDSKTSSSSITTTSILLKDLNPAQVRAVTQPSQNTVTRVLAGPGSGKTRVLTCRIAYLLEENKRRRENILAVTFTRKAAGEMQSRVEALLQEQQEARNEQQEQQKQKRQRRPLPQQQQYDDADNDQGQQYMENSNYHDNDDNAIQQEMVGDTSIPEGLERVTLGTFHSICAKILRYNGNLLASLPSVVDDVTTPANGAAGDANAAINLDGNFAILDQSDQLRILRECMDEAGIDLKNTQTKPLSILTAIGQIKELMSQGEVDPFAEGDGNGRNSRNGNGPSTSPMNLAKKLYFPYRQRLFTNNALDFDDLIYMTRELLMRNQEIRERLHRRWPHVLVDEFQDTSKSQLDLVQLLTSSTLFVVGDADQSIYSWRGAHAGSMDDFAEIFKNSNGGRGVETVHLKENYRSTSNIVRAAEKVISSGRPNGKGSSSSSSSSQDVRKSMKPKRGSGPSPRVVACKDESAEANFVVDSIIEMLESKTIGPESTVAVIYRTNAQSRHIEEACVQKNIPYVIRGGAGGFYKRAEVKDCLCYLRWIHNGNDEGSMLRAFKTPSRGIGDVAMREFKEYCEEVNAYHRKTYPPGIMPKKITPLDVLLSMTAKQTGSFTTLGKDAPTPDVFISKRALNKFLSFSLQMRGIMDKAYKVTVDKLLFSVIEDFELLAHFDSMSKSKSEFEERQENVQELRQATKRYSNNGAPALHARDNNNDGGGDAFDNETPLGTFLDDVALVTDITGEKTDDSRLVINLMTIHASKGMEFDAVFVVGNEEGTLPSGLSIQEGEDSVELAEEKRLCYVAMTRAKTQLCMTWRKEVTSFASWSDSGTRKSKKERSRFLNALVAKKSSTEEGDGSGGGGGGHQPKIASINGMFHPKRNYSTTSTSTSTTNINNNYIPSSIRKEAYQQLRQKRKTTQLPETFDDSSGSFDGNTSSSNKRVVKKKRKVKVKVNRDHTQPTTTTTMDRTVTPPDPRRREIYGASTSSSYRERTQQQPSKAPYRNNNDNNFSNGKSARNDYYNNDYNNNYQNQNNDATSDHLMAQLSRKVTVPKKSPNQQQQQQRPPIGNNYNNNNSRPISPNSNTGRSNGGGGGSKYDNNNNIKSSGPDSTWFFPIGSTVTHKDFGKGTVLPPPSEKGKEMFVRVQFQNGQGPMEFHAAGNAIMP